MLISQDWVTRILGAKNPGWNVSAADMDSGFVRVGFETCLLYTSDAADE